MPCSHSVRKASPRGGKPSVGSASYIESASNFNPSINILQKNKFTLKEVSQNEKVTHHSLPLRGGRWRRRRRMRADRKGKPQHKMIFAISAMFTTFAMFAQCKKGFPLGGRKLQAVCRRRRLMRGDQSALSKVIHAPYAPHTRQSGATAAPYKAFAPPDQAPKLPPCPRRFQKANQIFASEKAGTWGKFSVREGGLEGEMTDFATQNLVNSGFFALPPSFKRGLSPSKVFFPHLSSTLPKTGRKGEECFCRMRG